MAGEFDVQSDQGPVGIGRDVVNSWTGFGHAIAE